MNAVLPNTEESGLLFTFWPQYDWLFELDQSHAYYTWRFSILSLNVEILNINRNS